MTHIRICEDMDPFDTLRKILDTCSDGADASIVAQKTQLSERISIFRMRKMVKAGLLNNDGNAFWTTDKGSETLRTLMEISYELCAA